VLPALSALLEGMEVFRPPVNGKGIFDLFSDLNLALTPLSGTSRVINTVSKCALCIGARVRLGEASDGHLLATL
jgi:hypothetical protein